MVIQSTDDLESLHSSKQFVYVAVLHVPSGPHTAGEPENNHTIQCIIRRAIQYDA